MTCVLKNCPKTCHLHTNIQKNQGRVVIVVVVMVVDSIPTAYPGCLTLLSAPGGNPSVLYYLVDNDNQDVLPLCDLKLLFDSC